MDLQMTTEIIKETWCGDESDVNDNRLSFAGGGRGRDSRLV